MQVHLGGHLSWYEASKRSRLELRLEGPLPLLKVLERLGVPAGEVALFNVNGRLVEPGDFLVTDEDKLELYPAMAGG